jgi:4-hydroxybutyryl-CoA dehydratase/vinylacetyl-CoA-Delta-isomerase
MGEAVKAAIVLKPGEDATEEEIMDDCEEDTMIRSVEQYLESLRDGRVIYCLGTRVEDVTRHPILRAVVQSTAMDYVFTNDATYHDLFVTQNEDGEEMHFLFTPPTSAEALMRRRDIFLTSCRTGGGVSLHSVGADALAALGVVAARMDKQLGTHYVDRVEAYRQHVQKADLGLAGAMTDVKGDRSLHPSKQQEHKDYYVRVVDRQKEGIIVRGAKIHISHTAGAHEAIVMPCRAHGEEDADYAVVFAIPLNAEGVKLITAEPTIRQTGEEAAWDYPMSAAQGYGGSECMIVFDDVFVPWERVFMCGEWQFSRDMVHTFATFHRLFGTSRMTAEFERLTGAAALIAEYNGLEKYAHIRDKLAWLAMYTEAVDAISKASCIHCEQEPKSDLVHPNMVYTNTAKYLFADNYHQAIKIMEDICGGIAAHVPTYRDWTNPETHPWLEKYLGGKAGVPTDHRLRALRLIKDLANVHFRVGGIHGEGSLATQRIFLYAGAAWGKYKSAAKRAAGIPGWEEDPTYGPLPDYPSCVASKLEPADLSYEL